MHYSLLFYLSIYESTTGCPQLHGNYLIDEGIFDLDIAVDNYGQEKAYSNSPNKRQTRVFWGIEMLRNLSNLEGHAELQRFLQ